MPNPKPIKYRLKPRPYEELPIMPSVAAVTVAERPYTGSEISTRNRDSRTVALVEERRQAMTREQVDAFAVLVDRLCRQAYDSGAEWMLRVARSKSNAGREDLYFVVQHWLCSQLANPGRLEMMLATASKQEAGRGN